jgi:hypothetical protein
MLIQKFAGFVEGVGVATAATCVPVGLIDTS